MKKVSVGNASDNLECPVYLKFAKLLSTLFLHIKHMICSQIHEYMWMTKPCFEFFSDVLKFLGGIFVIPRQDVQ